MNTLLCISAALLWLAATGWSRPLRVVCFGDSTTAPRTGVQPYCDLIREPAVETINRGVPGDTTETARRRFAADVLDLRPDVAIIQFGINDSTVDVWKTPPAVVPRVPVGRFTENLTYFVASLLDSHCRVILMTFNPLTWTKDLQKLYAKAPYEAGRPDGFNSGRQEYLAAIRNVAGRMGASLIDVHDAYLVYGKRSGNRLDDLLLDGMHPDSRGHRLTAELLLPLLRQFAGQAGHAHP